jgi:F-type H+-transporting ATPase subunit delta
MRAGRAHPAKYDSSHMVEELHKTVFDTGRQHLGTIYAKALLGASERAGNTESVVEQLESLVSDVLTPLPQLEAVLVSPRIPWEVKEQMLERAFGGRVAKELLNFLKVVTRRGRFDCLRAIASSARMQFNELRGRVQVQVRSAEPLDQSMLDAVTGRLTSALGRQVELQLSVDPDLIGGLVVRVGDTVYDGSVANRLRRLGQQLIHRSSQRIREDLPRFASAN